MGMLEVKNLTKKFGGLTAVNDLSFTLEEEGIHALIGPNGSGKSTTINLITGIYPANEGSVLFEGKECLGREIHDIARMGIRRTWQDLQLFTALTVMENVMVGAQSQTTAGMVRTILDYKKFRSEEKMLQEKAKAVLHKVGLWERRNEVLSGQPYGIRKLTALALVLVSEPKFLLLDEPAAGLNPSERNEFLDVVLKTFDSGIKILIVEHNMDVVMSISKKITVLDFGRKIAEGSCDEIRTNEAVIAAYLGHKFAEKSARQER